MVEPRVEQDPMCVRLSQPRIPDPPKATAAADIFSEHRSTDIVNEVGEVRCM
jgi:hypothetical protein